jgi:hypothetical protein
MLSKFRYYAAFCLLASFIFSCQYEEPESDAQGAYYLAESRWPSTRIGVCWDNPTSESKRYEFMVQKIIVSEYSKAGLTFFGWKKCKIGEKGIHISWSDKWPSSGVGPKSMDGRVGGFKMAYDFRKNEAKLLADACHLSEESLRNCIETVALHEMGHAIGLAHENRRPETSCHQYDEPLNAESIAVVGSFDHESIMNKCSYRPQIGQVGFRLSQGDIKTIKVIFSTIKGKGSQLSSNCKEGYTYFPKQKRCLISQDGKGGCGVGEVFDDGTQTCKKLR